MGVISDAIDALEDWCCDLFKDGMLHISSVRATARSKSVSVRSMMTIRTNTTLTMMRTDITYMTTWTSLMMAVLHQHLVKITG